jgi:hypothetical protein
VGGDARQSQIHGCILRRPLPERNQVGFSLVEQAGIIAVAQGAGQAQLVLRIRRIACKGSAKGCDGVVVVTGGSRRLPLRVQFTAAGLLVRVVAGDEMAYGSEAANRCKSKDEQDDGRGARNEFSKPPQHTSYHDIILRGCEPAS